jgi:Uma2 family endonuclease
MPQRNNAQADDLSSDGGGSAGGSSNLIARPEIVEHVLLYDVSWEAYEQLLQAFGDRRFRHTYIDGVLEITSPLRRHELVKKTLARLIEMAAYQLDIEIESIGSTTLRRRPKTRGLEPDECYYLQHAADVAGKEDFDPERDPPPDLAIEVNVTHADLSRESVYAALGVPEIWHFDDEEEKIRILALVDGRYQPVEKSIALGLFTSELLQSFLERRRRTTEKIMMNEFVAWLATNGFTSQ